MSFEADLKAHLQGASAISALTDDRIYPVLRPQGAGLPAVTYQIIARDHQVNLDGGDSSLRQLRVQLDCWARSHEDAMNLLDAVIARLDTAASSFRAVLIAGAGDEDYEPETKLYRRTQDFSCWYRAT